MDQPILVPLDGSDLAERALPYAEALAESVCELILLEVGPESDADLSLLERHADSCAQLATAVGDPAEQILQVARDLGVGLIVMTTHGQGGLDRFGLGRVADEVTRRSTVPVLGVRSRVGDDARAAPAIRRIVVPLDGSRLAEDALPTAQAMAKRLNVPIHLLTAIDPAGHIPTEVIPAVAFNSALYEETDSQLETEAQAMLSRVGEGLQREGVPASWEVLHGSPYATLAKAVQPGDLIVMTSHGRGGVKRWLLGSVAETLIREAPVPIVLVPARDRDREGRVGDEAARSTAPGST
jgi:nucleotide-binding universal stress UspA family protein